MQNAYVSGIEQLNQTQQKYLISHYTSFDKFL
jgi:hypothetical protein